MQIVKRIKTDISKNQYIYGGGIWIRNFTNKLPQAIDINQLIYDDDISLLLGNEMENAKLMLQGIDTENKDHSFGVIVSDGLGFEEIIKFLDNLPNQIIVIGVNNVLNKWSSSKRINYYVVNNPYNDCLKFFPISQKVWPRCIASTRTNPNFVKRYQEVTGMVYDYTPTKDRFYHGRSKESIYQIDDYRNPICAAIGLFYRFGVKKLLLLTCDEASKKQKAGMEKLKDDIWIYPQQKRAHDIIDANLWWLNKAKIKTGYCSEVLEYENAEYINGDNMLEFFKQD